MNISKEISTTSNIGQNLGARNWSLALKILAKIIFVVKLLKEYDLLYMYVKLYGLVN